MKGKILQKNIKIMMKTVIKLTIGLIVFSLLIVSIHNKTYTQAKRAKAIITHSTSIR